MIRFMKCLEKDIKAYFIVDDVVDSVMYSIVKYNLSLKYFDKSVVVNPITTFEQYKASELWQ